MMPPSNAPPGVKIMTGGQLSAVPPAAELLPEKLLDVWGLEIDQRDTDGGLAAKVLAPALHVAAGLVLVGLMLYLFHLMSGVRGGLGRLPILLVPVIWGIYQYLKWSIPELLGALRRQPLKIWLIFSPGRIAWLRKNILSHRMLILNSEEITGLTLAPFDAPVRPKSDKPAFDYDQALLRTRQPPGPDGSRPKPVLSPDQALELLARGPATRDRDRSYPPESRRRLRLHYRLAEDDRDDSELILSETGGREICAWTADVILKALAPRTVPYEICGAGPEGLERPGRPPAGRTADGRESWK